MSCKLKKIFKPLFSVRKVPLIHTRFIKTNMAVINITVRSKMIIQPTATDLKSIRVGLLAPKGDLQPILATVILISILIHQEPKI